MVAEYTTIAIQICITATENAHGGTPPRDTVRKKRSSNLTTMPRFDHPTSLSCKREVVRPGARKFASEPVQNQGSCVLGPLDHLAFNLGPVDLAIDLLVHFAACYHVIASDQVQTVLDLRARLGIIGGADDSFDGIQENQVSQLIRGKERPQKSPPVNSQNQDFFFYGTRR
ncbi:hypothetical protein APSETT444_005689 [Aspergillus pseudonomiae]